MLKLVLLLLVLVNGALFAYHQGHLESMFPSGREPTRISQQLNADKITLIPASGLSTPNTSALQLASGTSPAPLATDGLDKVQQIAAECTEIGSFNPAAASRFELQLQALPDVPELGRRETVEAGSHMVLIAPQPDRAGADRKAAELRQLAISEFYVIQDNSVHRFGISLGVFRTEEAATAHLISLTKSGVRSASVVEHKMPLKKIAFQLRGVTPDLRAQLARIVATEFAAQQISRCPAPR